MREMLEPVFGESGAIVAQFFVILIFVLILIGVGYLIFRRYYGTALTRGGRSRPPRLGIVDSISVDHRRRLVLVRRDNVEHLLLIGSNADLVVESEIARAVPTGARPRQQTPRQQSPAQPEAQPQPQPQSRPQPQAQSRPQPQGQAQTRLPPSNQPPSPQPRASAPVAQSRTEPLPAPDQPKAPQTIAARPQAPGMSEPIPFPQHRRPPTRPHPPAAEPAYAAPDGGRGPEQPNVPTRATTVRNAPAAAPPVAAAATGGPAAASASAHFEEPAHPTTVEPAFSRAKAPNALRSSRYRIWKRLSRRRPRRKSSPTFQRRQHRRQQLTKAPCRQRHLANNQSHRHRIKPRRMTPSGPPPSAISKKRWPVSSGRSRQKAILEGFLN